jgi:hypothetical protein
MPAIDEVVQGVRGGGFVGTPLDLAQADVVDDQELRARPALEATCIGSIRETRMEVVEQIDTARVAHADALFARAQAEGLEDVTLPGPVVAGDHEVIVPAHEVEASEFEHERLVEAGLKSPVEGLERLALGEPAIVDPPCDPLLEPVRGLAAEDMLEQCGVARTLARGPREELVERLERAGQAEEFEVSLEPGANRVVVGSAVSRLGPVGGASFGHGVVSWAGDRDALVSGRRSYAVRSRGIARA